MRVTLVYAFTPDSPQIQSPYCITRNLHRFLSERCELSYYQWDQKIDLKPDPEAIFIGHPHYDHNTVVQKVFRNNIKFKARCTFHPFHHGDPAHNSPFNFMAKQADRIFSICGPYWYDTIDDTAFRFWKEKMVRLDMAVDGQVFPFVKKQFNPPGKRRLLYMGSSMPMKNVGHIANIMRVLKDVELHWYGGDGNHPLAKLPNVKTVGWIMMNRQIAEKIANDCDIMINVSTSDANPTTLLEARAWGLITACSKQSGYHNDQYFTNISASDPHEAARQLRPLLNMPSAELMARAKDSRKEIETRYSWDVFCNKIWEELKRLDQATPK